MFVSERVGGVVLSLRNCPLFRSCCSRAGAYLGSLPFGSHTFLCLFQMRRPVNVIEEIYRSQITHSRLDCRIMTVFGLRELTITTPRRATGYNLEMTPLNSKPGHGGPLRRIPNGLNFIPYSRTRMAVDWASLSCSRPERRLYVLPLL